MGEQLREHYFFAVRIGLLLALEIYISLSQSVLTGASARVLLLLAFFVGIIAGKEWAGKIWKILLFAAAFFLLGCILSIAGNEFRVLGIFLGYELLTWIQPGIGWYFLPLFAAFIPDGTDVYMQLMIGCLLAVIYMQHDFVVESYRQQTKEDNLTEQNLKHNMYQREYEMQEEMRRNLLQAENQILEERESLSQTLHDKLGHNINGSVYQLEAVKVLMDKDPETSREKIQAVINQLRGGMDEIRAILRRERPEKYRIALLQLEKLCEDCRQKGVNANLLTEGILSSVPEKYLEIILDNAFEAVSNSMKYAKCTKITIRIMVLNQMVRCNISDNL